MVTEGNFIFGWGMSGCMIAITLFFVSALLYSDKYERAKPCNQFRCLDNSTCYFCLFMGIVYLIVGVTFMLIS